MNEQEIRDKFNSLKKLIDDDTSSEQDAQRFLEQHPFMVAGFGGHVSMNIVVSQLRLGTEFRTDFAWLDRRSVGTRVHLIEIESPKLKMFNAKDDFTQGYSHAVQQLRDWHHWTSRNSDYLQTTLEPLGTFSELRIECHLVAGRRSELSTEKRKRRYRSFHDELQAWMNVQTWDGLIENIPMPRFTGSMSDDVKCVTYRDQGFFEKQVEDLS